MTGKLLTLAALFCACGLRAATEDVQIGKIKVTPSLDNTPAVNCKSTYSSYGRTSLTNKRWLVVQVEFTPGISSTENVRRDGGSRNPRRATGAWADDVKLVVRVLYPAVIGSGRRATAYGLFSGSTLFWSLPLDGKQHSTAMMVPPQLLDRYMALRSTAGGSELSAAKSDFMIEAAFYDRNGREIGYGYYNVRKDGAGDLPDYFNQLCEKVPRRYLVPDSVFSKDRTPWGVLDFDEYDLVKPAAPSAK